MYAGIPSRSVPPYPILSQRGIKNDLHPKKATGRVYGKTQPKSPISQNGEAIGKTVPKKDSIEKGEKQVKIDKIIYVILEIKDNIIQRKGSFYGKSGQEPRLCVLPLYR